MTRSATQRRPAARAAAKSRRVTASKPAPPSLRELWLAGLGAAATASEAAAGLVDVLVAKGRETEPRVRANAVRAVSTLQARLQSETRRVAARVADDLGARAKSVVEGVFDQLGVGPKRRAKNVLHRLGDLAEAIL